MTNSSRFFLHLVALTGLTGFLWSAPSPMYGTAPVFAADAPSAEVDPESGKRPGEAGSESDETRAYTGRTNLPLPRYASLRADEVNLRTGPGVRYPIDWVFQRRGLPVEITAEFENWRKVRDNQGTEGWVHRQMLSGKRSLIIGGKEEILRRQADSGSPAVARVAPGVVVQVLECNGDWCRVEASGFRGWLQRSGTWGSLPDERIK